MTRLSGSFSGARIQTVDKWAALISSTRTKKRPFSLLELASLAKEAIKEEGGLESAADRILLSSRMLKQFLLAERLDSAVKPLVADRRIDSIDAVGYLVLLASEDQTFVAHELAEKRIQTSDLRAICDQRRLMPRAPISRIVKLVRDSRSKVLYVAEFSVRGGLKPGTISKRVSKELGNDSVADVELDGPVGRVLLTRKGRDALRKFAKDRDISLSKAVPRLIYQL